MKNSLSKTLLCGILASSFFIVNCQKAPSRGVKAAKSGDSAAAANKLANKVVADCNPSFVKALEEAKIPRDKIKANVDAAKNKTKTLSEAEKAEIVKVRSELKEKNDLVKAEMNKHKVGELQADACKTDKATYLFEEIKTEMDNFVIEAGVVADVANDAIHIQTVKEKKEREIKTDSRSLFINLELITSKELAEVLKPINKGGVVYFKNSTIVKEASDSDKDKDYKDKSKTVCEIRNMTSDEKSFVAGDKLKVIKMGVEKEEQNRKIYSVNLGKGDQIVSFYCFMADGKEKVAAAEFRSAMGANLLTQAQIDAKKIVLKPTTAVTIKSASSDASDAKSDATSAVNDEAFQTALEAAKADYEAKDKAWEDAKLLSVKASETKDQTQINAADKILLQTAKERIEARKVYEKFFEGLNP